MVAVQLTITYMATAEDGRTNAKIQSPFLDMTLPFTRNHI